MNHITYTPTPEGRIPPISPQLTLVDVLPVNSTGFETNLRNNFYNKGNELFDSLYNAGNPLAYWSQVYDLRFNHAFGNTDVSTITTNLQQKTSDASYFREFLRAGGALYIQTVRGEYANRNTGVEFIIKNFTRDKDYSNTHNPNSGDAGNFVFHNGFNNFNCNFNDLEYELTQNSMTWAYPGGFPTAQIRYGIPLVSIAGSPNAVIVAWKTNQMDPEIGNGILVVGWAITAWAQQNDNNNVSIVSRTTFATIQNLYALMSETAMFNIHKSFSKDGSIPQVEDGETGTCYITLKNNAIYEVEGFSIKDTLSKCFEYVDKSGGEYEPKPNVINLGNGKTELVWTNVVLPGNRGSVIVQFDYKVKYLPPCD
jgi:hypothetical protein